MMKTSELRKLSKDELLAKIPEMRAEMFKLREEIQQVRLTGKGKANPAGIKNAKRTIARVNTILGEKANETVGE